MNRLGRARDAETAVELMRRHACSWVSLRPCRIRRGWIVYGARS